VLPVRVSFLVQLKLALNMNRAKAYGDSPMAGWPAKLKADSEHPHSWREMKSNFWHAHCWPDFLVII
jgi:hypothetical protein